MNLSDLLGLWPTAMIVVGILCRLVATRARDRFARSVLDSTGWMALIAGSVAFALLFGHRVGL